MEQLSFIPPTYKYIIDTSSILTQKPDEIFNRNIHKSLWNKIDDLIKKKAIIICCENAEEIKDEELKNYLPNLKCDILELDDDIQEKATKIINEHTEILNFKGTKSSADVFTIATALKYNLTIITEEKANSPKKIPQIASYYGVQALNINQLCEKEGWIF
jgi:hypothetical protein